MSSSEAVMPTCDPRMYVLERAEKRGRRILDASPTVTKAEVSRLLQITLDAVDRLREEGRLLGVTDSHGEVVYPWFQFMTTIRQKPEWGTDSELDDASVTLVPGLETVLAAIPFASDWIRFQILTIPIIETRGLTIIELLRRGETERALDFARSFVTMAPAGI